MPVKSLSLISITNQVKQERNWIYIERKLTENFCVFSLLLEKKNVFDKSVKKESESRNLFWSRVLWLKFPSIIPV